LLYKLKCICMLILRTNFTYAIPFFVMQMKTRR
jgi:hypothetical protein